MAIGAKTKNGYTLIELTIAIGVLSLGVLSSFYLLNQALRGAVSTRDRFIATYLVSEGVEIVRNLRDTNWRNNKVKTDGTANDWRCGLVNIAGCSLSCGASGCGVDYTQNALLPDKGTTALKKDNGAYQYTSGGASNFKRLITVTDLNPPNSIKVVSEVRWGSNSVISVEAHLYNWKE